jgi:ferric-dicitrate binding protein FerR (iron transport regulator)
MIYLSASRLPDKLLYALLALSFVACKGPGPKGQLTDTTTRAEKDPSEKGADLSAAEKDKGTLILSTLPDGTLVLKRPLTVLRPSRLFNKDDRTIELDGEALFIVGSFSGKPFIIHTRNLVITVQAPATRLHVDAYASSPGEEVDLLEGKLRVTKSYHSSTDNEPEVLMAGDMVMINRDIDLMEKEKLEPAERKAVEKRFPMPLVTAPRN